MADTINTRDLVLEMLIEINEKNQYSHLVERAVLSKYQYLSKQDRAFMTRLLEGTLERRIELDYIIDSFSKTKVRKMKPLIRNLLRMSVYQLKYMENIPDSAVCNEAVKLAKKHKFTQLSGFVNGVLRNIARNQASISYPDKEENYAIYLEVKYSMPQWIVEKWLDQYGKDGTEEILLGFDSQRKVIIRTNISKCSPKELKTKLEAQKVTVQEISVAEDSSQEEKRISQYAFVISGFDYLEDLEAFNQGLFYVQDMSSMMVAEAANPKKGDYVIDVCAAPGGKSCHVAELLAGTGMVEARDLTDYKVELIEDNISRNNLSNMKAVCMDARVCDPASKDKADVLICDLPCSGLGVLGRKKDIRFNMTPDIQKDLVQLQRQILDTVKDYVKPGGVLIYSTCTINIEENQDNTKWFQDKYPQFHLEYQRQMLPGQVGNDGFFFARFTKDR